jgi:hypothetical protein
MPPGIDDKPQMDFQDFMAINAFARAGRRLSPRSAAPAGKARAADLRHARSLTAGDSRIRFRECCETLVERFVCIK